MTAWLQLKSTSALILLVPTAKSPPFTPRARNNRPAMDRILDFGRAPVIGSSAAAGVNSPAGTYASAPARLPTIYEAIKAKDESQRYC